jgi:FkbM family methyltransferase
MRERLALSLFQLLRMIPLPKGKERIGIIWERLFSATGIKYTGDTVIRMNRGYLLRVNTGGAMGRHILIHGEYDDIHQRFIERFLEHGAVVLDVGANIGAWSIPLGLHLKAVGGGKLFAFEPVKNNFLRLHLNIELNSLMDIVFPVEMALGNTTGSVPMSIENEKKLEGNSGLAICQRASSAFFSVPLTTVDEFIRENDIERVDFIKIDIEGAEGLFLDGANRMMENHRPIILGEFCRLGLTRYDYSIENIITRMENLDYICYDFGGKRPVLYDRATDSGRDLLMLPRDRVAEAGI